MTPEPKHISGPSGLSEHKPATQAMIRARRTGFGLIHAYKEVVCLAVGVYFVNLGRLRLMQQVSHMDKSDKINVLSKRP